MSHAETQRQSPMLVAAALQARAVVLNRLPAAVVRVWADTDANVLAVAVHPLWQDRLEDWPVPREFEGYRVERCEWNVTRAALSRPRSRPARPRAQATFNHSGDV
jgi:hypothetical protein